MFNTFYCSKIYFFRRLYDNIRKGDDSMHETPIYVRFCETDALGHTNNTSYFFYFEESRMKFLNTVTEQSADAPFQFVVARITCDYIQQSYAGDALIARTHVEKIGSKSFTLRQEVLDSKQQLVASGECVIVCFSSKAQTSVAIPDELREKLEQHIIHAR